MPLSSEQKLSRGWSSIGFQLVIFRAFNNQRSMIRRKRVTSREEQTEREESMKESQQRRKESTGKVHRFNYGIDSMPKEEEFEHSQSRVRRHHQEYRITSCENQPPLDTKPLQHQPTRLLKKDYLYERSIERQDCRHGLATINMNTSFDLNGSSYLLADREDFKNTSFQSIGHSKKYSVSSENGFLFNNNSKRLAQVVDFPNPCLGISEQYTRKSTANFEHTKTEEELQIKYQEIYANNQKEKLKNSHHNSQVPTVNTNKENIVINTRLINNRNTVARDQSHSIGRKELSSGSNTQRLQSSAKKTNFLRAIQTRKTSPSRFDECRVKQVSEMKTLRSSPVRNSPVKHHIDSSLKLIDDFSLRISCKIEELTATLHSLRVIK